MIGRPRDERESAGHPPVLHVVPGTIRRVRSLGRQDAEEVAVVGCRRLASLAVAVILGRGGCDQRPERAHVVIGRLPVEASSYAVFCLKKKKIVTSSLVTGPYSPVDATCPCPTTGPDGIGR